MKVFNEIGSKDRFLEVFQRVNKVQLNEAFGQSLNPNSVLEDSFNQLKSGNLKIEHSNTQASGNESFVELVCFDKQNNNITFTFKATLSEGDQDGVYSIDSANMVSFSFDDSEGANSVEMDENALKQFNMQHGSEIADIVDEYVSVDEPVDADMDEQYRTAIERIDAVPYKKGTQDMVKQKQYGDEKPTNPDVRAGDEFNKFLAEDSSDDIQYNPEEIETGFELPDKYGDTEEPEVPEVDNEPVEDIPEEKKQIILQAYDSLMAKNSRNPNYSPTFDEVMNEIEVMTGQKVVKEKTRVFPKEAEPWLEEGGATITPISYSEKMLSPEKKREYVEKAMDFLETRLGAEKFFGMPITERVRVITDVANQMFFAEMTIMNEEEKGDYPDQMGKTFKPKSKYPKKKKKPQTTVKIDENDVEVPELEIPTDKGSEMQAKSDINKEYPKSQKVPFDADFSLNEDGEEEKSEDDGMSFEPKGDEVEQLAQDKEQVGDMIPGGKADEKSPQEFDPEQILKGIEIEMEHTDNPMTALEIAMDHLTEFPDYYTRLDAMEKQAKEEHGEEGSEEKPEGDDEMTDVLLGYEPKNVGDEVDEEYDYAAAEVDYENRDAMKKYLEYSEKDFNNLRDDEKEEYFELWKQFKGTEKVNEESIEGEKQLSDFVDAPGGTEIWYAKNPSFDDWEMREKMYAEEPNWKNSPMEYTKKYGPQIDPNNLEKTHALLGTIAETDPNKIFEKLNNWGGAEVNVMLRKKGLSHTSMSIGDIIKIGNKVLFVDGYGFKDITNINKPNNVSDTGDVMFGSSSISEAQVKKARLTLSNRNIPTGMTKKEAVQILIKNNTRTIL